MKRIERYETLMIHPNTAYREERYNVWFEGVENPLYCNPEEFRVLQIEDLLCRNSISKIENLLKQYKDAISDLAVREYQGV